MSTTALDIARLGEELVGLAQGLRAIDGGFGLTPTQATLLGAVSRSGPIGLSQLARQERIHPTQVSRSVGALEARGLLRRTVDPSDRRAASVETTAAGARLLRRLRDGRIEALRAAIAQLGAEDVRRLENALPVLEAIIERLAER
jgi:DNA-binding MarR family transcriptional regulator